MATSHSEALGLKPGARGRRDNDGQNAVIKLESLTVRVDELVKLHNAAATASADLADAIKDTAEKAGLNAATVRKFIAAKAGEKFDETREKIRQLALVFEEIEA